MLFSHWLRRACARPSNHRLPSRRPATARPHLEELEDRLTPAVQLTYGGPGTSLNLTELLSGATPTVSLSEPAPNRLTIDLGAGQHFDSTSVTSATGLTYQNAGSPTTSQTATIDISTANNVSSLLGTLGGDTLNLGVIVNAAGGLGNLSASADTINAASVYLTHASSGNGNLSLTAAGGLTVLSNAVLDTGLGSLSLAADVNADGTGNSNTVALAIQSGAVVVSASASASAITLRGYAVNIATGANPALVGGQRVITTTTPTITLSGVSFPSALAFDSQGNLFVVNSNSTVSEFAATTRATAGGVVIRTALSSEPITLGGSGAGQSLSNAQLAQIVTTAGGSITFGDSSQTGDISFQTAILSEAIVRIEQSPTGPGAILLDDGTSGVALNAPGSSVQLAAGSGGIEETNTSPTTTGIVAATIQINSSGSVGSLAQPLTTASANLNSSTIQGSLYLADPAGLTTTGPISVSGIVRLGLGGDFTTHAGDLHSLATSLSFSGTGTQHFDSDGQTFASLVQTGPGTLVLRSGGLNLTGNLLQAAGQLDTNDQPVTVRGVTIVEGLYFAGSAPQNFLAGLIIDGGFSGGSGTVTASGIALSVGAALNAPAILNDSGDWINSGGIFEANGGTVVFTGSGTQSLTGGLQINGGTFHGSTGSVNAKGVSLSAGLLLAPALLDDSGDWTVSGGTFTANGGTVVFNGSTHLTSGGQTFANAINAGTLTLQDNLRLSGNFTSMMGQLNASNQTIGVGGNWVWAAGVFTSLGNTADFQGSGNQVVMAGGASFFNLSHSGAGTLLLGSGLTVNGTLTLTAGTFNANGLPVTVAGQTVVNGGTYLAGGNTQTFNGGLSVLAGNFTGSSGVVNARGITLSGGTLTAPLTVLMDSGNWQDNGGTFKASNGTVVFNGSNQLVSGTSTFHNLTKMVSAGDTLNFQAGSMQTITGTLLLLGAPGKLLLLRSSVSGSPWKIGLTGNAMLSFVDVQDSNATALVLTASKSLSSGNNANWRFV